MSKLWQLLNSEISFLSTIAISLTAMLVFCMVKGDAMHFFVSLVAILAASAVMLIYWFVKRNSLSSTERWSILISVAVWLALFYSMIHSKGLVIWSYF
jgi:hypothetical protein